jgi:hypothetical protein
VRIRSRGIYRGHCLGDGATTISGDEKLHQVLVGGRAGGLHEEHVATLHTLLQLHIAWGGSGLNLIVPRPMAEVRLWEMMVMLPSPARDATVA